MSTNNSIRICPNCNGEFSIKLKRNGEPTKKQKECCSKSCANIIRAARSGSSRAKSFTCEYCLCGVTRPVRKTKDSGRFCSRDCAFSHMSEVKSKKEECLRKERIRSLLVKPETDALKRIRANTKRRTRECRWCSKLFIRPRPFLIMCSDECLRESKKKSRERSRKSESYRKQKRIRRAMERGGRGADKIDPIEVFEKAGWKCYLCGIITLKEKRGTAHDMAPELEHVVPISKGGKHTHGNVACSCRKCNIDKGATDLGLFIRSKERKGSGGRVYPKNRHF